MLRERSWNVQVSEVQLPIVVPGDYLARSNLRSLVSQLRRLILHGISLK